MGVGLRQTRGTRTRKDCHSIDSTTDCHYTSQCPRNVRRFEQECVSYSSPKVVEFVCFAVCRVGLVTDVSSRHGSCQTSWSICGQRRVSGTIHFLGRTSHGKATSHASHCH